MPIFYSQELTGQLYNALISRLGAENARAFLNGNLEIEFQPVNEIQCLSDADRFAAHDWTLGDLNALVKRIELPRVEQILTGEVSFSFKKPRILRLISGDEVLVLKALDGSRLIYKATKTFKSIDPDFVGFGINKPGIATLPTLIQIHEIISGGTFINIFRCLPGTWNQKWVSQDQVIEFCETLSKWLGQGEKNTLFLVKKDENKPIDDNHPEDNLAVVGVCVLFDSLNVSVFHFRNNHYWHRELRYNVVSREIIPSPE